ncbi:hypothetical protein Syun_009092 [Stephania yunnanensis]|uniref:Uncharacterized protein n=1 Tax=Stephania yunnanensis TaxID=152371 RepID=A0AAP0KFI9_9MAGN
MAITERWKALELGSCWDPGSWLVGMRSYLEAASQQRNKTRYIEPFPNIVMIGYHSLMIFITSAFPLYEVGVDLYISVKGRERSQGTERCLGGVYYKGVLAEGATVHPSPSSSALGPEPTQSECDVVWYKSLRSSGLTKYGQMKLFRHNYKSIQHLKSLPTVLGVHQNASSYVHRVAIHTYLK